VPILARRPSASDLESLLEQVTERDLNYAERGATREGTLPRGYRHGHLGVELGRGEIPWTRGREALRHWQAHRHVGATLTPTEPALEPDTTLLSTLRTGPMFVVAPCRIVYVTDEPERFGFAYGTLPGHPERGEEAFHVVRSGGDAVRFEITVFSRPADLLVRLGGPIARLLQDRVSRGYLEGVRSYVGAPPAT
jgi:uncharacterized protein (UPF0548 family)